MLLHCRIAALLLLLLLLVSPGAQAQSGDGDTDLEARISCNSNITKEKNYMACRLLRGRNDDEDDEDTESDSIEKMTLCYIDYNENRKKCVEGLGDTISFRSPLVVDIYLTVQLKKGGYITTTVDLKKIVKPSSPRVHNVTFNMDSNQAVIYIQTLYKNDYLKIDNQDFQLHICTAHNQMIQNISATDNIKIDMESLQRNTEYRVKVRAIPRGNNVLRGSWSDWSETFTFFTPAEEDVPDKVDDQQEVYILIVCLISSLVVISSVVFLWKNKIFTYMWPSIPHPKNTLVQICQPNKGLLLNFKPEVFSSLKIFPMDTTEEEMGEEPQPVCPGVTDGSQSNESSSTQSSDCRSTTSVSTEELELSALLSRSSSDGEDSLLSSSPSPINILQLVEGHIPLPESSTRGNQEEAYVTMSSFYQIK